MISDGKILISGAGIAGLTLAVLLKEQGLEPLVIERDQALRTEEYTMDFFGSGWDVAARMGLEPELRAIHYPIDQLQFVNSEGAVWFSAPIDRIRSRAWRELRLSPPLGSRAHSLRPSRRARRRHPFRLSSNCASRHRQCGRRRIQSRKPGQHSTLCSAPTAFIQECAVSSSARTAGSNASSAAMSQLFISTITASTSGTRSNP